jgi:hypothetical protein
MDDGVGLKLSAYNNTIILGKVARRPRSWHLSLRTHYRCDEGNHEPLKYRPKSVNIYPRGPAPKPHQSHHIAAEQNNLLASNPSLALPS